MKQNISTQLLSCALLLSVSYASAMNNVMTHGINNNNNLAPLSLNTPPGISRLESELKQKNELALQLTNAVVSLVENELSKTTHFEDNKPALLEILRTNIVASPDFSSVTTWKNRFANLATRKSPKVAREEIVAQWVDSLNLTSASEKGRTFIVTTLKGKSEDIFNKEQEIFAKARPVMVKSDVKSKFNLSQYTKKQLLIGSTILVGIMFMLYKYSHKVVPSSVSKAMPRVPQFKNQITFKIPFYNR